MCMEIGKKYKLKTDFKAWKKNFSAGTLFTMTGFGSGNTEGLYFMETSDNVQAEFNRFDLKDLEKIKNL